MYGFLLTSGLFWVAWWIGFTQGKIERETAAIWAIVWGLLAFLAFFRGWYGALSFYSGAVGLGLLRWAKADDFRFRKH